MKADCDGNCTNCNETELPNIKDKNCQSIGYSYAYKTDCAGDRYIKAEEVKYLLKCERNKAIDDFSRWLVKYKIVDEDSMPEIIMDFNEEKLKEGGENEK